MQDIHHISEYGENDIVKQKYEGSPYSNPSLFKNEQLRNFENNMTEMDYNQNPPENHLFQIIILGKICITIDFMKILNHFL